MDTSTNYFFPFGQRLTNVHQVNTEPKTVFVLSVYASDVHARWTDKNSKQKVAALAVAGEPSIFWTGDDGEEIISAKKIPAEPGTLTEPKVRRLNGPSVIALDELFLAPPGYVRDQAWLFKNC